MNRFRIVIKPTLYLLAAISLSCTKEVRVDSPDEFLKWVNSVENGLVKERKIGGFEISFQYVPAQLSAFRDCKSMDCSKLEDISKVTAKYENNLTFIMTIGLQKDKHHGDVMTAGISDYKAYSKRFHEMNFAMEEYITLKLDDKEFKPVLAVLENTYGITGSRKINVVFANEQLSTILKGNPESLDLVFYDDFFNTGISHFVFNIDHINSIPEFPFQSVLN